MLLKFLDDMKKSYLFTFCFLCLSLFVFGQDKKVNLSGQISQSNGDALAEIPLQIVELEKNTLTNTKGQYSFEEIPARDYHLKV